MATLRSSHVFLMATLRSDHLTSFLWQHSGQIISRLPCGSTQIRSSHVFLMATLRSSLSFFMATLRSDHLTCSLWQHSGQIISRVPYGNTQVRSSLSFHMATLSSCHVFLTATLKSDHRSRSFVSTQARSYLSCSLRQQSGQITSLVPYVNTRVRACVLYKRSCSGQVRELYGYLRVKFGCECLR